MELRRRNLGWVAAVLSAIVLAGCGSSVATGSGSGAASTSTTTIAVPQAVSGPGFCPAGVLRMRIERLPARFDVTGAVECSEDLASVPGRGQWLVEDEKEASSGLSRLASALRHRDQAPPPGGVACAAVLVPVPQVVVVGGGKVLRPRFPLDECHQPQSPALSALRALPWRLVHRRLLRQVETPAELASGCPSAYKDLFDLDAASFVPARTGPLPHGERSPFTICVYRDTNPALNRPDGRSISGADIEIGAFAGWTRQRGTAAASLLRGLSHERSTATCVRKHPAFATISGPDGQPDVLVELGGCDRVLRIGVEPAGPATPTSGSPPPTAPASMEVESIGQAAPAAVARIESLTKPAT